MGALLLALLAGAFTTLSPCVLPILPIVLAGAASEHRFGPLAMTGGLVIAFTALGLLVSGSVSAFDIPLEAIHTVSAVLLVAFGAILASGWLKERFASLSVPVSNALNNLTARLSPRGLRGQFLLGALLGALWTPCSGPTLGAAIALAANSETLAKAGVVMLTFSLGTGAPLLALAYGSRRAAKAPRVRPAEIGRYASTVLGVLILLVGVAILIGLDKRIEARWVSAMPDWLLQITTRY